MLRTGAVPDTLVSDSLKFAQFTMAGGCLYYHQGKPRDLMQSCGGSPVPVYAAPEWLDLAPYGSSDGSHLYFGSHYEGVLRLSLTETSSAELLTPGGRVYDVTVDQNTVYYNDGEPTDECSDMWGIYSVPKTGGTRTELLAPPIDCPLYMTVDSEAIYCVNDTDKLLMKLAK
jgi:hypothetical protein